MIRAAGTGLSVNFLKKKSGTSDSHAVDTQTIINQQILAQLTDIGQRLKKLEKTDCKKSNDVTKHKNRSTRTRSKPIPSMSTQSTESTGQSTVNSAVPGTETLPFNSITVPSLVDIRQNANIQEKIDQRIKELQQLSNTGTDSKIKSLRGGSVDIFVKNRVKWPHEHVLAGNIKERVSYDQLTMGQWMAVFCRTMREEKSSKNKEAMLDYLVALLDDSNDFSWAAAKASHAVLLCRMEQGEIVDYTQTDLVDRVRRAHAQRHITHTSSNATQNFKNPKQPSPCLVTSTTKAPVIFQRPMKQKGCFTSIFVHFVFQKGARILHIQKMNVGVKNKHAKKRLKLGGGCHSNKQFASKYFWSSNIDRKTISREFSVDISTLSTWFTKANAFANIRNGRSYAQVTAQKTLLPVSAACIRKTRQECKCYEESA